MVRLYILFPILLALPLLISCQRQVEDTASLTIQLPSAQSLSKTVGAYSQISPTLICYIVNVTGPGITESTKSCDIKRGVFAGSVAPGSELSVTVPSGSNRTVEIYGLLRTNPTDACPTVQTGWPTSLNRVFFLGQVTGVDVRPPTTTVNMTISLPDETQNILSQFNFPATCSGSSTATKQGRIFPAAELSVSIANAYKKRSHISFKDEDQKRTSTSGYKMLNSALVTGM